MFLDNSIGWQWLTFSQIETANASDRKQYILITPQDMGNVSITDSVKVHRMSDPERRAVN